MYFVENNFVPRSQRGEKREKETRKWRVLRCYVHWSIY